MYENNFAWERKGANRASNCPIAITEIRYGGRNASRPFAVILKRQEIKNHTKKRLYQTARKRMRVWLDELLAEDAIKKAFAGRNDHIPLSMEWYWWYEQLADDSLSVNYHCYKWAAHDGLAQRLSKYIKSCYGEKVGVLGTGWNGVPGIYWNSNARCRNRREREALRHEMRAAMDEMGYEQCHRFMDKAGAYAPKEGT